LVGKPERKKERDHLEDLDVHSRIYWNGLTELGWKVVDWTNLAADREKWRDVARKAMNHWFS
jgi:hypothetical protein